jgi:hypothetical protein
MGKTRTIMACIAVMSSIHHLSNHPAWAAGFSLSTLAQLNIQADAPQWIMVGFGVVTALIVSLQLFALVVSVLLLPAVTAHKYAVCSAGRIPVVRPFVHVLHYRLV